MFLAERELSMQNNENSVQVFYPGTKFEYLGFQFQFANCKNPKINKGKYRRYFYTDPFIVFKLKGLRSARYHTGLLLIIRNIQYKAIKLNFRRLFMRNRTVLSVERLIKEFNR